MPVLLTPEDIADRLGRDLTVEELRRVTAWIADLTAFAFRLAPCLKGALQDSELVGAARAILAGALVRTMSNPAGLTSERIGDYAYTRGPGADTGAARAAGLLTEAERAMLAALCTLPPGSAGSTAAGAYSVPLAPPETTMGWPRPGRCP